MKGFTLIELIIVVAVLSVISLLTTPLIFGAINNSKITELKSNSYRYITAIEKYNELSKFDDVYISLVPGYYDISIINDLEINDELPSDGWIIIDDNNEIEAAIIEYDNILINQVVVYYDNEIKITMYSNDIVNPSQINTKTLENIVKKVFLDAKLNTIINN